MQEYMNNSVWQKTGYWLYWLRVHGRTAYERHLPGVKPSCCCCSPSLFTGICSSFLKPCRMTGTVRRTAATCLTGMAFSWSPHSVRLTPFNLPFAPHLIDLLGTVSRRLRCTMRRTAPGAGHQTSECDATFLEPSSCLSPHSPIGVPAQREGQPQHAFFDTANIAPSRNLTDS